MRKGGRPTALALGAYGGSFALLLLAAAFLGGAVLEELRNTGLLWVSAGFSVAAAALAIVALVLPGRGEP